MNASVQSRPASSSSSKYVGPRKGGNFAHVICAMDYVYGDPAASDIFGLALNWFGSEARVNWFAVDDLSPIEVGFNLATRRTIQGGGNNVAPFTVFLGNAAPRKKQTKNLEAAPFVSFELKNGVYVFTTLSESFDELALLDLETITGPIRQLKIQTDGTQFRSLFLPEYAARYCSAVFGQSDEELSTIVDLATDFLPDAKAFFSDEKMPVQVIHVDNFGNIKLSLVEDDARCPKELGSTFQVMINGVERTVTRGKHLGDTKTESQLVLYPGSSISARGRHMELCVVGRSAAAEFQCQVNGLARCGFRPRAGTEVQIIID